MEHVIKYFGEKLIFWILLIFNFIIQYGACLGMKNMWDTLRFCNSKVRNKDEKCPCRTFRAAAIGVLEAVGTEDETCFLVASCLGVRGASCACDMRRVLVRLASRSETCE